MDEITISNLEIETLIGISDAEREETQKLLVSITMETDTREAGTSDDVQHSIDYADVASSIKTLAETKRKTVERFAEDTADMILTTYAPTKVTVSIKKFALPETDHVAITITRP
jgi:dihydroneopterin aldolase